MLSHLACHAPFVRGPGTDGCGRAHARYDHAMTATATATATRFAAALDEGDWAGVAAQLHDDCGYECRGSTMRGAAAIVDSYRGVDQWVKATFDNVRYESAITALSDGRVRIDFRDRMDHGAHHLDFRCAQLLTIGGDGRITAIEHVDLPGERDKADAFNAACGVTRPG
jgi:hypothetical protein